MSCLKSILHKSRRLSLIPSSPTRGRDRGAGGAAALRRAGMVVLLRRVPVGRCVRPPAEGELRLGRHAALDLPLGEVERGPLVSRPSDSFRRVAWDGTR